MGDYLLQIRITKPMSAKYLYLKVKDICYSVVQSSRFWNLDSLLPDRVCVDSTFADHPPQAVRKVTTKLEEISHVAGNHS